MTTSTERRTYPLALRDVPPGPGYVRLPLPPREGLHTGGPWFHPQAPNLIWKPLDARPFANAEVLVATREDEILALLAGMPGFPPNWARAVHNGRRWLVRRRAVVMEPDVPATRAEALAIEQGLRALSAAGWCLNDHLTVARDPDGAPFVLDLSNAAPESIARFRDDWRAWCRWAREVGHADLADLREAAHDLACLIGWALHPERHDLSHVYACTSIELADGVAGALLEPSEHPGIAAWLLTPEPLDQATCQRFGLVWGWSPIEEHQG